mmetsp:Transcript_49670/g.98873  ORF Transcript_49670/g.98873 Transcript_49670/m.98873 type:complete len:270 (-) Transcript_49670:1646-2455(-)
MSTPSALSAPLPLPWTAGALASSSLISHDVATALADVARGVNLARTSVYNGELRRALQQSPCASLLAPPGLADSYFTATRLSVCPGNGTAHWGDGGDGDDDDALPASPARAWHRSQLDGLLAPLEPAWVETPGDGGVRLIATTHYTSDDSSCAGIAPLVLRIHIFCSGAEQPNASHATRLLSLALSTPKTSSGRPPSWLPARPSVESRGNQNLLRCQLDGFLESSALCNLPPFGDVQRTRRAESLLRQIWQPRNRSGFVVRHVGSGAES